MTATGLGFENGVCNFLNVHVASNVYPGLFLNITKNIYFASVSGHCAYYECIIMSKSMLNNL